MRIFLTTEDFEKAIDDAKMKSIQFFHRACDKAGYVYIAEHSSLLAYHIIASKKTRVPELWVAGDGFDQNTEEHPIIPLESGDCLSFCSSDILI